jgi:ATP diphosphatase
MKASKDISRLIEIMAALRTPKTGCPWDLDQTFSTIAPYTIEEAYEVADAIGRKNMDDLRDELGDLLFQVVYHARMAEEVGAFDFGDVVEAVTAKMIRRHPHVFGDETARTADMVTGLWERIKAEEKAVQGKAVDGSLLDDVSVALPALTRAVKLQSKAAKVGFDWPSLAPVFAKLAEEIAEFEAVALPADPRGANNSENRGKIEEEFGDILFAMANVARHLKLDAEAALRSANAKFVRRFQHIEAKLAEMGSSPAQSTLEEMDALWDEVREADKRA